MKQLNNTLPVPRISDVFSTTTNRISVSSFTSQITDRGEHNAVRSGQHVCPVSVPYPAAVDLNGSFAPETKCLGSSPTGNAIHESVASFDDDVKRVLKSLGGLGTEQSAHDSGHRGSLKMSGQNGMYFIIICERCDLCLPVVQVFAHSV